jgi:hypothetical protein
MTGHIHNNPILWAYTGMLFNLIIVVVLFVL